MRVERLGDGHPEVAVVGAVHGDEPCGARAIERLLAADPDVERPVALIVANETALDRGVRYVDEDLNRAFPGDPEADSHERRLAHRLRGQLRECVTLSMHSTQSHDAPFAIVREVDALAEAVCPQLSIEAVVESAAYSEGRLIEHADVVEVECGLQGSDAAADNAYRLVREFLAAVGALRTPEPRTDREDGGAGRPAADPDAEAGDERSGSIAGSGPTGGGRPGEAGSGPSDGGPSPGGSRSATADPGSATTGPSPPTAGPNSTREEAAADRPPGVPVLRLVERVPKPAGVEYAVFVENFERVAAGEPYAATDGETLRADEPFYPVLLSPYGYEEQFGYKAELVGRLDP